jgi:hypothetical protein
VKDRVARALVLACLVAGTGACDPAETADVGSEVPNLTVSGYVTINLDPAYGEVALYDAAGLPVGATVITGGKFGISRPVEAGTPLCGGWVVRAFVEDPFGPREAEIELDESSGTCVMPADRSIQHWVEFDLAARTSSTGS